MLVDFDQHATGLHVLDVGASVTNVCRPTPNSVDADAAGAAPVKPPALAATERTIRIRTYVVVDIRSAEHHPVSRSDWVHRVAGVSAVPGHRQAILANLITDGERRVLRPVPGTGSTLDLHISYFSSRGIGCRKTNDNGIVCGGGPAWR